MANKQEVLVSYPRSEFTLPVHTTTKLAVGERGERVMDRNPTIKNRPLVIGISSSDEIVIGYPKGSARLQGYHADPGGMVLRYLDQDLRSILHGSVRPESSNKHQKALHIVEVFKMHPDDVKSLGGINTLLSRLSIEEPWELGRVIPEQYINESIAQRIMYAVNADRLNIIYSKSTHEIYGLPKNRQHANV